jgi:hypothetical protein
MATMRMRSAPSARAWIPFAVASVLSTGCYEGIDDASRGQGDADSQGGGSATDGDSDDSAGDDPWGEGCEASVSPLRRLSEVQYRNTLADLFAPASIDVGEVAASDLTRIPADDIAIGFGILDSRVSELHVRAYYRLADRLSRSATSSTESLTAFAGACAVEGAPDEACVDAFLDDFGLRTQRRPLTAEERAHYHALGAASEGGADVFRAITFALMMTPQFLYHVQVDGEGDDTAFALGGYELASRLSFHFWQTMPDAELFAAAADGSLLTEEGFAAQLDRVFEDPRTRRTVERFYDEWLRLGWITVFPDTPAFRTLSEGTTIGEPGADHLVAAQEEIHALVDRYTFEQDGTLADLFLTDISLTTSAHLAALYGVEPWDGQSEPPRMPAGQRAGLMTRAAFLITGSHDTHPIHRGAVVRRRLLCDELPSPDPSSLPPGSLDPPPVTDDQTTRERYELKTADSACTGCHAMINPLGFVLEQYDALGRHRTEERIIDEVTGEVLATLPIDSNAAPMLSGEDDVIGSGIELSAQALDSGKLEACFARQYFRATFGRTETTEDACAVDQVHEALLDGGSMREALRSIALAPMFRARRVE